MRGIVVGIMLACAMLSANAADESISIGGVRLTLGMARSKAIELLQKNNIVSCLGKESKQKITDCDLFVSRGDVKKSNFVALGSVNFSEAGRIKLVMKNYDQKLWNSDAAGLVSFLHEVLRQYGENGQTFEAALGESREPEWISKGISFRAGRKTIVVSYGKGGRNEAGQPYQPFTTIYERLE